jgi:hypothetical protein
MDKAFIAHSRRLTLLQERLSTGARACAIIGELKRAGAKQMFAKLKAAWERLVGPGAGEREGPPAAAVEYKGYRIKPAPYKNNGGYQTAGSIEKDTPDGVREHRFIRADAYPSREDAINFTISKAKQIIDLQGDRIFDQN